MDATVPARLIAGDTWEWVRALTDYPAPTWVLSYALKNANGGPDAIVAVASGTQHAVTVPAATTAAIAPGRYRWFASVTAAGVRKTVEEGWVEVAPDPSVAGALDARSLAQQTLDAVDATIKGRATQDQLAMSVNGRSISRTPIPELIQLRDTLRREVNAEGNAETKGAGRDIKLRMLRG